MATSRRTGDRERSFRFAMCQLQLDLTVIGFKSRSQIDEAIEWVNRALVRSE